MLNQNKHHRIKLANILRWMGVMLVITNIVLLTACTQPVQPVNKEKPAQLTLIPDTGLKSIVLTQKAAERIGIQTVTVAAQQDNETQKVDTKSIPNTGQASQQATVPYSSVIYDVNGETWVYINPEPLTYMRYQVHLLRIEADRAILAEALPDGTEVVTTGAIELYGAETGVGK